ncbi:hypothetical protein CsatB_014817 [Cannabis sativa]
MVGSSIHPHHQQWLQEDPPPPPTTVAIKFTIKPVRTSSLRSRELRESVDHSKDFKFVISVS